MKPTLVPLIENPCPVKWESMLGDEKRRYCEHCQLHVHNLSAMTKSEQREVLKPDGSLKCVNYLIQPTNVTVSVGSWLNRNRWQAALGKIAAVFVASLSLVGVSCQSTPKAPPADANQSLCTATPLTTPDKSVPEESGKSYRMGGSPVPPPPPPFWKRLFGIY